MGIQHVRFFEILDRSRHILPIGILRQDRSDRNFELGVTGPPVLGPKMLEKCRENRVHPIACHLNPPPDLVASVPANFTYFAEA
jgi:hypothetical protein